MRVIWRPSGTFEQGPSPARTCRAADVPRQSISAPLADVKGAGLLIDRQSTIAKGLEEPTGFSRAMSFLHLVLACKTAYEKWQAATCAVLQPQTLPRRHHAWLPVAHKWNLAACRSGSDLSCWLRCYSLCRSLSYSLWYSSAADFLPTCSLQRHHPAAATCLRSPAPAKAPAQSLRPGQGQAEHARKDLTGSVWCREDVGNTQSKRCDRLSAMQSKARHAAVEDAPPCRPPTAQRQRRFRS